MPVTEEQFNALSEVFEKLEITVGDSIDLLTLALADALAQATDNEYSKSNILACCAEVQQAYNQICRVTIIEGDASVVH